MHYLKHCTENTSYKWWWKQYKLSCAFFFNLKSNQRTFFKVFLWGWNILYCCYKNPIQLLWIYFLNRKESWVLNKMMLCYCKRIALIILFNAFPIRWYDQSSPPLSPPPPSFLGDGGLSHFSERVYRRDLGEIMWFWVGIGSLGGGDFFQVGLENSLYKK